MGQGDNNTPNQGSPNLSSQQYQPQPYGYQQQPQPQQQQQQQQQQQYQPQPYGYQQQPQQYQPQPYGYQPEQQQQQQQQQYDNNNQKSPLLSGQHHGAAIDVSVYQDSHEKFPVKPEFKDKLFHILFYINIIGVIVVYLFMLSKDKIVYTFSSSSYLESSNSYTATTNSYSATTYDDLSYTILALCAVAVVYGVVYLIVWMRLASKYPKQLITYSFIANMVLIGIILVLGIIFFNIGIIIIAAICLVINLIFFIMWRKRIEFTGTLLSNTTHLLHHFPGTYRVAYGSLAVSMVWFTIWGLAFQRLILVYEGGVFYGISIYLVFSLYWVSNVIKNTVHVTVSGLFASWYFLAGSQMGMPRNPTLGAFKRAMTTSFGSICLGSLLLAIISTLRYCAQLLQNSKNAFLQIIGCFLNCILGLMQSILAFFNVYTFTQVAIYGKSYCDSAKDTLDLFQHRLGSILINDDFISVCLYVSSLLGAIIGGFIGAVITKIFWDSWFGAYFVFLVSFIIIVMALEIVYSGVVSLFVCYLMEPNILKQTKPEIFQLYNSTYKIK